MTDYAHEVREILDGLMAIPLPADVNIESWSHFVIDRQEWIDELALLVDRAPTLVQGLLQGEFANDLQRAMSRVDEGVAMLQLEMQALSGEMETARQTAVRVNQLNKARPSQGTLLGVG